MAQVTGTVITVFDIGKTNAKMLVLSRAGEIVLEERSTQRWVEVDGCRILDEAALWQWINTSLSKAVRETGVRAAVFTTHGLTVGYVGFDNSPLPVLDYEAEIPAEYVKAFAPHVPPFAETCSPILPVGFNIGAQIDYLSRKDPEAFSRVLCILGYPQYLAWKLTGEVFSEKSFIGSSSHCWSPLRDDFSSLVYEAGWRKLFPAFLKAGEFVGKAKFAVDPMCREVRIFNGIHDSNAALFFYRTLGHGDFTLVSTGTWVIIFNPSCPLDRLDSRRDMLANVTTDGEPVATLRFMGGRDYETISGSARAALVPQDIADQVRKASFALPSFSPGGQFPNAVGRIEGPEPETEKERAALASLYLACMTANGLDQIHSSNKIIVDGGFCRNKAYLGLIAALRATQQVFCNTVAEGTSLGAASTISDDSVRPLLNDPCEEITPWEIPGLERYFYAWKVLSEDANSVQGNA